MSYFRQPRYLNDFKCIGGNCRFTCCQYWRIVWSEKEIEKVKNAPDCPEDIRSFMETGFTPYPERKDLFIVTLDEDYRCPMLTEDKFCHIQREMGEEYLSNTCRAYPRNYDAIDTVAYGCCQMSCPEIMNKLLNDEKCTDLVNLSTKNLRILKVHLQATPEQVKKHPERKYFAEIKDFFYEIISNKKLPLETCIILGALAAQSLTKLVAAEDYDSIPEAIKTLRSQMHDAKQLKNINNIKTNYNVKLGVTDKLINEFSKSATRHSLIDDDGKPNIDLYTRAEDLLNKEFESRPFAWRNLALNLMLELNVPFKLEDNTIFENYSAFVIAYAFLRYNTLTIMGVNDRLNAANISMDTENFIVMFSSVLSRTLCHNPDNLKKLLQRLKDFKMESPAYLALLVK